MSSAKSVNVHLLMLTAAEGNLSICLGLIRNLGQI